MINTTIKADDKRHCYQLFFILLVVSCGFQLSIFFYAYDLSVPSDTNYFLHLLALVRGDWPDQGLLPLRIDNPLYSLLILVADYFFDDWVYSAKVVALVPGFITPVAMAFMALQLSRSIIAAYITGLLAILSVPLTLIALYPLSDSWYIFWSVLTLLCTFRLLNNPDIKLVVLSALFAGLAWSTRAPGLFYIIVIVVPLYFSLARKSMQRGYVLRLFVILFLVFMAAGKLPSLYFYSYADGREANDSYLKSAIIDGVQYAKGEQNREVTAYSLNEDASGFEHSADMRALSWPDLIMKYGWGQLQAFIINVERNFREILPGILAPFFLLCIPFGIGCVYLFQKLSMEQRLALVLYTVPYLLIIPAIQLHPRYIYPMVVVCLPAVAFGLEQLLRSMKGQGGFASLTVKLAPVVILIAYVGFNSIHINQQVKPLTWPILYKAASEWILDKHEEDLNFAVMSRYHGVYAYMNGVVNKTSLPVDSLERIAAYCQATNTRYVFVGPVELNQNPLVRELVTNQSITRGDVTFQIAETFQVDRYALGLVQVTWDTDSKTLDN